MNLTIDAARELAKKLNTNNKTDIFTINSQFDAGTHEFMLGPHRNGEEISEVIKREIKELLTDMINQYPNDASLGAAIRIYNQNTN
jgi:hypothetical protein